MVEPMQENHVFALYGKQLQQTVWMALVIV